MKIYLAGPMKGLPDYNFPAFMAAAAKLRAHGHEVWNPAEQDVLLDGFDPKKDQALTMAHYMTRDLPAVCQAEAIVLLPGWRKSRGANLEVYVGACVDKMIFEYVDAGAGFALQKLELIILDPEVTQ